MNYTAIRALLNSNPKLVLTTHKSPDGDAIGSILGLTLFLKNNGLSNVTSIVPDPDPFFLHDLPGHDELQFFSESSSVCAKAIEEADVFIHLDFNTLYRVGDEMKEAIQKNTSAKTILIDHHQQPDEFDFMLSDVNASSTAELVVTFCQELYPDSSLNLAIAENLYTGIVTDTGSFRFSSTGENTHLIAAKFKALGLDTSAIHQRIFDNNSLSRLRLMGYALSSKLKLVTNGKASYTSLTSKELEEHNYVKGDTEGLVNYGLSIAGVEVTAFFREAEDSSIKISFRSKGKVDVNQFARAYFNGGGHKNAAGGRVECTMNEAIELFEKEILNWL